MSRTIRDTRVTRVIMVIRDIRVVNLPRSVRQYDGGLEAVKF